MFQPGVKSPLAKGQVWRTRAAHLEVMGLGKEFIYYKVTNLLGTRHISAQVSAIQAFENYLLNNQARLVEGVERN